MTSIGRRGVLAAVGGLAGAGVARAQLPSITPPATVFHPAVTAGVDKTKSYYVFFDQQIDVPSMRSLRQTLANLSDAGVPDITLVIDSGGGAIEPMLVTYSFIQALPTRVNTHATGFVASAATLLYLAGEGRSADRSARFTFHPGSTVMTGTFGEDGVRERQTMFNTLGDIAAQIYHDRTTLPAEEYARFNREAVTYTAEQAHGFGIVQTVADLRMPGEGRSKVMLLG